MDERLFNVLVACIPVLGAIVTYFVIPLLKEKIGAAKLDTIKRWVEYAVKCAELLFNEQGLGSKKKQYVIDVINGMLNKDKEVITKQQLDILIEACVKEMKDVESK